MGVRERVCVCMWVGGGGGVGMCVRKIESLRERQTDKKKGRERESKFYFNSNDG